LGSLSAQERREASPNSLNTDIPCSCSCIIFQLLKELKRAIPDPINKVISVQGRYEMYVEQISRKMIKKGMIHAKRFCTIIYKHIRSMGNWGIGPVTNQSERAML
jgi:hypothetical protein